MARKSYALLVALLVTFILLDCFTECGAAKKKGKGKGKARQKHKGKFREESPTADIFSKCVFEEQVQFICGSDGVVYMNKKNMECGQLFDKNLKEADPSSCSTFPKTDEEKKKREEEWKKAIKELNKTARKKDRGKKSNRNDKNKRDKIKKQKDDKKKRRKG